MMLRCRTVISFAAAAVALLSVRAGPARAAEEEITVLMWGTTWQTAFKDISDQFTKESGIRVKLETQTSAGEGLVKLQAMREKPTVDVWFTTASVAARAATDKQLFAELPLERMPNLARAIPGSVNTMYAPIATFPIVALYRPDLVTTPINSWEDLWKPEFKGKIAAPNMQMYQARLLLLASVLGGGNEKNVEPGFERLKSLKPNVALFYASDAQGRQAVAQGEAPIVIGPPSYARFLISQNIPVKMVPLQPAPLEFDMAMIVRTDKNEQAAKYINFLLGREVNEQAAAKRLMLPSNVDAQPAPALAEIRPAPGKALVFDEGIVNANIAAWTERFNREIVR
jgi:putative spermidine/putrescine transport system substrate-binding protein